jgi:VanZ family protein
LKRNWVAIAIVSITIIVLAQATTMPFPRRFYIERQFADSLRALSFAIPTTLLVIVIPRFRWHVLAAMLCLAALMEAIQYFVPGRHPQLWNAAAKMAGCLLGAIAGTVITYLIRQKPRRDSSMGTLQRPDSHPPFTD